MSQKGKSTVAVLQPGGVEIRNLLMFSTQSSGWMIYFVICFPSMGILGLLWRVLADTMTLWQIPCIRTD